MKPEDQFAKEITRLMCEGKITQQQGLALIDMFYEFAINEVERFNGRALEQVAKSLEKISIPESKLYAKDYAEWRKKFESRKVNLKILPN